MNTVTIQSESYQATDQQVEQIRTMLKPKVRDGMRTPNNQQTYWYVNGGGTKDKTFWNACQYDRERLLVSNVFLIESNCDLKCEQLQLTADLNRWVDEHDARGNEKNGYVPTKFSDGWTAVNYGGWFFESFNLKTSELCDLFITENKSKLDRLKEIEETLDVTLYR